MALGEAQVKITPDLSTFKSDLIAGINSAMRDAGKAADEVASKIESEFVEASRGADQALKMIDGDGMTQARSAAQRAGDQVETELEQAARESDKALAAVDGDDFKEVRKQADKAGKDIGDSFDDGAKQGQNALKGFAQSAAFAAATAAVAKFAKSSIDAFADLGETLSKAEVVFGDATDSIVEFGDRAAESMGQSKQAAIAAASDFAIFGGAAGLAGQDLATFSTDLTMLASDLASFSNTSPEEAVLALGAALRGESEPIRRYGVLLDDATLRNRAMQMGIYDGNGALSQQQRVLAANAEIFAQTGLAQGDFERTSDSLSNSQKILSARFADMQTQVGEALAPAMQMAVDAGTALLSLFSALPSGVQGVIGVVSVAAVGFIAASRAIQAVGVAASTANKALGAIGLILTGATVLFSMFRSTAETTAPWVEEFAETVDLLTTALRKGETVTKTMRSEIEKLAYGSQVMRDAMIAAEISVADLVVAVETGEDEALAMGEALRSQAKDLGYTEKQTNQFVNELFLLARANVQAIDKAAEMGAITTDVGDAVGDTTDIVIDYTAVLEDLERTSELVSEALINNVESTTAWKESLASATESGAKSLGQFEIDAYTSISEFEDLLKDSMNDVMAWQGNLLKIASETSPEFAAYLAELGPAAAGLVADLANSGSDIQDTFNTWVGYSEVMNRDFVAEFDQTPAGVERRMADVKSAVDSTLGPLARDARLQALAISDAIMLGLVDGINSGQPNLVYAAAGMVNTVVATAKSTAGIRSPSTVFANEVGAPIAQGVADGITSTIIEAKDAMIMLVDDLAYVGTTAVEDFTTNLEDVLKTSQKAYNEVWETIKGRRSQEQITNRVADAEEALAEANRKVTTATNEVSLAQAELLRVQLDATSTAKDIADAQRDVDRAQRDLNNATRDVERSTKSLEDANFALLQSSEHLLEQGPEAVKNFENIARAAGLETDEIAKLVTRYNELAASRIAAADAAKKAAEVEKAVAKIGQVSATDAANEAVRQAVLDRDKLLRERKSTAAAENRAAQAAITAANVFAEASGATAGSRAFAQKQLDALRFIVASTPWLGGPLKGVMDALARQIGLANGAIVDGARLSVIGEAGPEAVIPLGRPRRAMQLMEQSGLADMARSQGSLVNIQSATFVGRSDADLVAQKVGAAYAARVLVA